MQPTFDQAFQILKVVREAGVSLEGLQTVYNLGLLSDLFNADNLTNVDREKFRLILGYGPPVFKVKMGGSENTDEIVANLSFYFDSQITQTNFPLKPSKNPWEDEIEIVDPDGKFSKKEGLRILEDRGLMQPTYEHAIRFA